MFEGETVDAKHWLENEMNKAMDLQNGPLFRVAVCKDREENSYLGFWVHHIISDAFSLFIIEKDFYRFYEERINGRQNTTEESCCNLATILAEQNYLQGEAYRQELAYWQKTVDATIPGTTLPRFHLSQSSRDYKPFTYIQAMTPEISRQVGSFAQKHQLTPYILLFSVFNLAIHFINEHQINAVGLFAANRLEETHLKEVGYFSNAIVYQDEIDRKESLGDYFQRVKSRLIQSFAHQHFPFMCLVQELVPNRESGMPFFNIAFDSLLFPKDKESQTLQQSLGFEDGKLIKGSGNYDLIVWVYETEHGNYELEYRYNGCFFDEYQISSLSSVIEGIISCLDKEKVSIEDVPALYGNYKQLVDKCNETQAEIIKKDTYQLFCEQAEKHPNKPAICFQKASLSYRDVDRAARAVRYILENNQIGPGNYVGVMGPYLIPAILGIWAAGAVYVPIDPRFPLSRQEYMINNTRLSAVLKDRAAGAVACEAKVILIEEALAAVNPAETGNLPLLPGEPDSPAYVLYTSGSTGNPKGVVIQHEALTNFLADMRERVGLKESDTMLAVTSISFDISILEMFLPLVAGADVVLMPYDHSKSGELILTAIRDCRITFMQATPSTYAMLYDYYQESAEGSKLLDTCLCGGESYELDLVKKIQEMSLNVYNVYGPTETTIWSTVFKIPDPCPKLKIGRPIANTVIRIADSSGKELPVGVPGELLIGGKGLFQGYYNAPELTSEAMITADNGRQFYRTGDWAYWNQDIELVFLGRRDSQIKIRGYRVELSEIENVFLTYEAVANAAVVTVRHDDTDILAAALTVRPGRACSKEQVQEHISRYLPDYMRPGNILILPELPMTNNNKIDKKAIGRLIMDKLTGETEIQNDAGTEQEIRLNIIWNEILKTKVTSVDKGFFEAGGNSLLLNKLALRLKKEYHQEVDIVELLRFSTIRKMALYLNNNGAASKLDMEKLKETAGRRGRFIQRRKM